MSSTGPGRERPFDAAKCGTARGRGQHRSRGEALCEPCRVAWNEVSRQRQQAARDAGWIRPSRASLQRRPAGTCCDCGGPVRCGQSASPRCAPCHKRTKRTIYLSKQARLAIYERDGWTCQICMEPVDRDAAPRSDWAPNLDHVVPRVAGGSDDESNLRLAHHWCNSVRGAGRRADEEFRHAAA